MSDEENFEVIRHFNRIAAGGDLSVLEDIVAPDFVVHGGEGWEIRGADGWREFILAAREQYGQSEAGIDELIGNGNLVAERWWIRASDGTRRGITMHRIADGKLQEDWVAYHEVSSDGS